MKKQNNTQNALSKDFHSVLEANTLNSTTCEKVIYDELKSNVKWLGEIISRMKKRNQLDNDFDKMDLDSIENLSRQLKNMLAELDEIVSKDKY